MRRTAGCACLLALTLLLASAPAALGAETADDAQPWLDKLARLSAEAAVRFDLEGTIHGENQGQKVAMEMSGSVTRLDDRHFRMSFAMTTSMPTIPEPIRVGTTMVADGESMWMEMDNPMLGGKQVMRLPIDKMEQLDKMGGAAGLGGGMSAMDPMAQVSKLAAFLDFQVDGVADGKVTLRARPTKEMLAELGESLPDESLGQDGFVLVLDEKTGFPTEMRMGEGERPLMWMRMRNVEHLDPETVDAALFRYQPPEGAPVMDMGAMLGAMGGADSGDE